MIFSIIVHLPQGGAYTSVGTYDHEELVSLVSELSSRTKIPVPGLIKAFGEYLFARLLILYPYIEGQTGCFDFWPPSKITFM